MSGTPFSNANARTNYITKWGHLALVSTAKEMALFQAFIQSDGFGPTNCAWVDGSDAEQEGVWLTSPKKW